MDGTIVDVDRGGILCGCTAKNRFSGDFVHSYINYGFPLTSEESKRPLFRKDKTVQRRDFLKTSMALAAAAARGVTAQERTSPRWYKGNIHCHSQWSDGEDLPEVMVSEYKNRGYQFFCLSDHNIIQTDRLRFNGFAMDFTPKDLAPFEGKTSFWKRVAPAWGWPNLLEEDIKRAQDRFGADSVDIIDTDEGR